MRRQPQIGDQPVRGADREHALEPRPVRNDVGRVVREINACRVAGRRTGARRAGEGAGGVGAVERARRIGVRVLRDPVGRRRRRLHEHVVTKRAGGVEGVLRLPVDLGGPQPRSERHDARAAVRHHDGADPSVLEDDRRHAVYENVAHPRARSFTGARRRQRVGRPERRARRETDEVDRQRVPRIVDDRQGLERPRSLPRRRGLRAGEGEPARGTAEQRDDLAARHRRMRGSHGARGRRTGLARKRRRRARIARDEHRAAALVATVERARRRERVVRTVAGFHEAQREVRDDDPHVARRQHERPQRAERRAEAPRVDRERLRAPVLDHREAAVRAREQRRVRRARDIARVVDRADHAHVQPPRAADQRGQRSGRRDEIPEPAQPRVVDGERIDRVAAGAARAARRELQLQRGGRGERVPAPVVRERDRGEPVRLFERRPVERQRAEEAARRVQTIERVVRDRPLGRTVPVQRERRVPAVERVRERRLPAERRERVVEREVDQPFQPETRELAERERGVGRIGRARQRILGTGEPTRLELAVRERDAALSAQRRGRERELCTIVLADRVGVALIPVSHRPHRRR
ncbi:MAG TPA: hypothetical protein VK665_14595 [Candidatus Elarobacter sp.]|nr:hypothetical protein [Candidatus Elarobacter sp.]